MAEVEPFTLAIPQAELNALNAKLDMARWPERELVDDWSQGTPLSALQPLVEYWRNEYDWRRCEDRLNSLGQFTTEIDGIDIHFLHIKSPHDDALPMIMTHGWPGSVMEFMGVIERLTQAEYADHAFHLVIPSLPGYGFSGKPTETGWGVAKIAATWGTLMKRLGYDRWVAQGGDWGAMVTTEIGKLAPDGCAGIHLNMPMGNPTPESLTNPSPKEAAALAKFKHYQDWDSGYSKQQATRPQTIGYSLVDSPVGLAGWILEKMWAWTDNDGSPYDALSYDRILDNIMLYWLPANGTSAARLYWESFAKPLGGQVRLPTGASVFPAEILCSPRSWADQIFTNIHYWNETEKGGHFAAWEQPEIFAEELRQCFQGLR